MRTKTRTLLGAGFAVFIAAADPGLAATMSIETHKDNTVDSAPGARDTVFDVHGGSADRLAIHGPNGGRPDGVVSYAAFDLSSLPANAVITGARIGAYDARTTASHDVYVALADVADNWDETGANGLTWNRALSSYGLTIGIEGAPNGSGTNDSVGMIDPNSVLWQGMIAMSANPGFVWAANRGGASLVDGADTYHGGVDWTEGDLIGGLNGVLAGDQVAVFAFSGYWGTDNFITERNFGEGPTLEITYEIIPEPASLGLLSAAGGLLLLHRRWTV